MLLAFERESIQIKLIHFYFDNIQNKMYLKKRIKNELHLVATELY